MVHHLGPYEGVHSFTTTTFHEGYSFLKAALEASGYQVNVIENHVAPTNFPDSAEALTNTPRSS